MTRPRPSLPSANPPTNARRPAARSPQPGRRAPARGRAVIDLDRYVPAYLTWVSNKLSRGASQHYLSLFGIGIESWRCLVLLALHGSVTAQFVSRVIGMDKGTVSRSFKALQERGCLRTELDPNDGRVRLAVLTPEGRALHDEIRQVALERERAFLSVLEPEEAEQFLSLLKRLHENLPQVEAATQAYIEKHFPEAAARRRRPSREVDEDPDL
ncbi:winged helix-turn-helix transcriptional regulator [Ramlibacter sp. AW1]|uniref:Winged helix-turn-helix transcriptional regulator n=1 Tax=Ramlibacter aurantiacus TaxID=2801330 RepID=A0A936ZK17_9BURK|nr:MarR family winged helix-turn-helix transcriptional regulator [Ramlibacter aurantiacus]MBL0421633.1 winged helix-turn-helix transcriptional regulator [Ramlibacter aurantiacus]